MKTVRDDKPLVILSAEIRTPPFSQRARREAGFLLRQLQRGLLLSMPESRPMPSIGRRCHELRIPDAETNRDWRVIYRIDADAVLIVEIFAKKTNQTPDEVISISKARLKRFDAEVKLNEKSKN